MNVVAIVPARGGSRRLPKKNIHPVLGVPMIAWVIRACREARRISEVHVSTEDPEIARVAREWGAGVIDRPPALAGDDVPKQEAIVHAVEGLLAGGRAIDVVLSVQPNSPELTGEDLDCAVEKLLAHDLREVFSVDAHLIQNGAYRVMRRDTVFWRSLSVHCGVSVADCLDVHTPEDVVAVEHRLQQRMGPTGAPACDR
jgi:CMP-N-acetylneuraminic acid synthetase